MKSLHRVYSQFDSDSMLDSDSKRKARETGWPDNKSNNEKIPMIWIANNSPKQSLSMNTPTIFPIRIHPQILSRNPNLKILPKHRRKSATQLYIE